MEWVERTGSTIEDAKENALDSLGVHEDDAEFEVVADVKTGLFGRVKEEARVRARVRPATPRAKDDRRGRSRGKGRGSRNKGGGGNRGDGRGQGRGQGRQSQEQKGGGDSRSRNQGGRGRSQDDSRKEKSRASTADAGKNRNRDDRRDRHEKKETNVRDDEPTMPLPEQADLAEDFVRGLADKFGTAVAFRREQVEDDEIRITVTGDDLGRMIGRRGTTAGAIDELVRTVLQRQAGSARNGRIRVDVGGVRARRAEALAKFSLAQAAEVRESGTSRSLEPMGAADRKIVHDALTDEEGVDTISQGEDPQRRVVIVPAGDDD